MANLTGRTQILHSNTTDRDSTQQVPLGTIAFEATNPNNEWIYLRGTASVTTGLWVFYDENYATTLAATAQVGPLAVAGTAHTASTYGFFQVRGVNTTAANTGAVAADAALYLVSAGAGYVDDADVASNLIENAVSRAASSGSAFTAYLNYPFAYAAAQD